MRRSPVVAILASFAVSSPPPSPYQRRSPRKPRPLRQPRRRCQTARNWAAGKIERFDASANTVVMKQGSHEMTFVLAPDAHVMLGKKAGQTADLASDAGKQARIRYTTQSDKKIADRIEIQETVKKK
jgi:hypothetical protein